MSFVPPTAQKQKHVSRLKPDENSFYVARDMGGDLYLYESLPSWNGFDFVPSLASEYVKKLEEEWFPQLEPGCAVKIGPYGNVIDLRGTAGINGAAE
jgi:hypothetical protein